MNFNHYNEHFAKNMKLTKKHKSLGIQRRHAVIFLIIALFASKVLLILSIYKYFLIFTLIISSITFAILMMTSKTHTFLKYFYYSDISQLLITIQMDALQIHGGQSIKSIETSIFNLPMHIWYFIQSIKSININQLFIAFALIFLLYLFILYAMISVIFFLENIINLCMTSLALEFKI